MYTRGCVLRGSDGSSRAVLAQGELLCLGV